MIISSFTAAWADVKHPRHGQSSITAEGGRVPLLEGLALCLERAGKHMEAAGFAKRFRRA